MNKKTAISQVNQQGKQNLSANGTHFANINAAKNVWWFDIPIHKLSDKSYVNLLLYDCSDRKLYHLEHLTISKITTLNFTFVKISKLLVLNFLPILAIGFRTFELVEVK